VTAQLPLEPPAPQEGGTAHVFLSHNSADRPQVIRLARALAEHGVNIWLDIFELKSGDWWSSKVEEALANSAVVLACIGEHGAGPWHDREISVARGLGLEVFVARLPGWRPELGLFGLDGRVAHSLEDWDQGFMALAGTLKVRAAGRPSGRFASPESGPFDGNPYPGIDLAFGPEHAAWFFGRETETAELVRELQNHRWVWLVGNSGSGKSSLARAGVMAWWPSSGARPGLATVFEPTAKATEDLAGALDRACRLAAKHPVDLGKLAKNPGEWSVELRARFGGDQPAARTPLLVVVDQAEQMFTSEGLDETCASALNALRSLTLDEGLSVAVHVLVVLRADWLHRALNEPLLQPTLRGEGRTRVTLPGMDKPNLLDAVMIPARRAGGAVDRQAAENIIKAVSNVEHGLPLLQLVLQDAWQESRDTPDKTIRWLPSSLGDVVGRLVKKRTDLHLTDTVLDTLALVLVEFDDRDAPRRRQLSRAVLNGRKDKAVLEQVLDKLVAARVVVSFKSGGSETDGLATSAGWRLAHDAVLSTWAALAKAIQRRTVLIGPISALGRLKKDAGDLSGTTLQRYEGLLLEQSLPEELRTYLLDALRKRDEDIRERNDLMRKRKRGYLIAATLVVTAVVGLVASLAVPVYMLQKCEGASHRLRGSLFSYECVLNYKWLPRTAGQGIADLVRVSDVLPDWVGICRAETLTEHNRGHHTGYLTGSGCHFEFGNKSEVNPSFEALVGPSKQVWQHDSNGSSPSNFLAGGDEYGYSHAVCRANLPEGVFVGKLVGRCCSIASSSGFEGAPAGVAQACVLDYEVLLDK